MEYACELWSGCSKFHIDLLEKLQLEAARIVTGLPTYASKQSLYFETGWEMLITRRERRKLTLFYKMHNKLTPPYLYTLLPGLVGDRNPYPLRNNHNYIIHNHSLTNTRSSFIPATTRTWNNLPETTRNQPTLYRFKTAITPQHQKPPIFFDHGPRHLNILLTKLRYNCSALNQDLYRVNLIESPSCACGHPRENTYHYLMECPLYTNLRDEMLNKLRHYYPVTLDILVSGNTALSAAENKNIFQIVQTYIRESNRF